MKTRRSFISCCSKVALAAALTPAVAASASPAWRTVPASRFELFSAQQETIFTIVSASGATFQMELAEARLTESRDPLASLAEDGSYEKYSLLFRGLGAFLLPQDTYTFKHRALGWTEIFIVPVKEWGPQHNLYAAFFDHPRAGYFGRPAAN